MPRADVPTNERIVTLLEDVLRQLKELDARERRIEATLAKLERSTK